MITRVANKMISDNPFQARMKYYTADLENSILQMRHELPETSGLIHVPPARALLNGEVLDPAEAVARIEDGRREGLEIQLAAGHRRLRAFRLIHETFSAQSDTTYATFPVDLKALDDEAMADIAFQENQEREDNNAIEQARMMQMAGEKFGWTQAEIGNRWGLSQSTVANKLRLLQLPDFIQDEVARGLGERHARALLPLVALGEEKPTYMRLLGHERSVVDVEMAVKRHIETETASLDGAPWAMDWEPEMKPQVPGNGIMHACAGCRYATKIGRELRCSWRTCFELKSTTFEKQVEGPALAKRMYEQHAGWKTHRPTFWTRCRACGTEVANDKERDWYRFAGINICPDCWERAGNPQPEEHELSAPEHIASAPVDAAQDAGIANNARCGVAVGTLSEPQSPPPASSRPAVPPPPPPKPQIILTARIDVPQNGESPEDLAVTVSVGKPGRPGAIDKSDLGHLASVMARMIREEIGIDIFEQESEEDRAPA